MSVALHIRSTEECAGKPELQPNLNGEQFPPPRVANLVPETVSPSRWWGLDLRRVWSLLFVAVGVALLTLETMGGRTTGFDAPAASVSRSAEEIEDIGPDRPALSNNAAGRGRRATDVQEARTKLTAVDPSDSPDVAFQYSATVSKSTPAVVPKTHISDLFRLVFVAGLEGTGHHYIIGTDQSLFSDNKDLPRRGRGRTDVNMYYAPKMMGGEAETFTATSHHAMANMRHLAEWAATLSSPGTLEFISIACSYPLNTGPLKVMQYMDLRRIAETAEGAGIDFRVLYMRRSAKDMVIANTVHRNLHRGMGHVEDTASEEEVFVEYMRVLFTDIAVLQSFLSEIGQEFIVCHDWDRLGGKEQASTIAKFISPNNEVADLVESSLVQTARNSSSTDALPFEHADALVSRLQRKLDAFEPLYCG
ncbi:unnamed protein product [Ectocarpus sp. 12 AP-2014]